MSNNLVILFAIAMILLCAFVLYTYIQTVHGYEQKYCSFGQRDNCINIIPQNQPISIDMIKGVK